jgi:hypothetical protein
VSDPLLNVKNWCCNRPKVQRVIVSEQEESLILDHEKFDDSPSKCSHVHGSIYNRRGSLRSPTTECVCVHHPSS